MCVFVREKQKEVNAYYGETILLRDVLSTGCIGHISCFEK